MTGEVCPRSRKDAAICNLINGSPNETPFNSKKDPYDWAQSNSDRRYFIGGSDARIIMGKDEKALLQL